MTTRVPSMPSVPSLSCSPSRSVSNLNSTLVPIKGKGLASTSDNPMGLHQFRSAGFNSADGGMGWYNTPHQHSISPHGLGFPGYMSGHISQAAPYMVPQVSTGLHSHDPYNQSPTNFSFYPHWEPPKPTLPFAVNHYLQTQAMNQPIHAPAPQTFPTYSIIPTSLPQYQHPTPVYPTPY